jgi:hypothetical protein
MFEANKPKAYSVIMQTYCSNAMKSRVGTLPNFEADIKNNPIEVLKAIQKYMLKSVSAKYPFATLTDTLTWFLYIKQQDREQLLNYVKQFEQISKHGHSGISTSQEALRRLGEDYSQCWISY